MSHWIKINDTRINVTAQSPNADMVIDALMNLYAAPSAEINRETLAEEFGFEVQS